MRKYPALAITTAIVCSIAASAPLAAQAANVTTRTLSRPEVELSEPFSRLMGVRELRDGRLIISDATEKMIAMVDLTKRTFTKIGSVGQGPGEYMLPMGVMAMPGDTTYVSDAGAGKYVKVTPAGTIAGDVAFPQQSVGGRGGRGGAAVFVGGGSGAADSQGRTYSRGSNISFGADGQMIQADSAPITRHDFRSGKTDTVAFMRVPLAQIQNTNSAAGSNVQVRLGGNSQPFIVQPTWAVAQDGRVALVTPDPFRVTWVSPSGQRTVGEPLAYQRIRVTDAEKEAYRQAFKASPPMGMQIRVDDAAGRSVSQSSIPFTEPASWPDFKHPYTPGSNGVVAAPTGELWIQRQLAHTEKAPTYDIIGVRGELTGRVVLPLSTRLLGFGSNGAVYLVRRDQDDLEYIQRHRLTTGR